ncbi:MAG: acyltransferase family protein [Clostridia bacterium]|nr:acyltransferase family protein [Clostridia bacterium]
MIKRCFNRIYSPQPCNTGRQFELDVFRFILIYRLAVVHVFVDASPPAALDTLGVPYYFDSIVGGVIGAPRFMIMMGIGLAYSTHSAPQLLFKRGLKLGAVGLLLNVFRYLIPSFIGYWITGDAAHYLKPLPYLFFGNDILQFAALAMLLMALLLYLKLTPGKIFLIALGLSILGTIFRSVDCQNTVLNIVLSHFVGVETVSGEPFIYSDFPLITWFIFYAFGYIFGHFYRHIKDKKAFYLLVSPICLVIAVAFCTWEIVGGFGMMMGEGDNVFYHMHTIEAFICIIACVGTLIVSYALSLVIPASWRKPITMVSRNVNAIYCIHWVLVWWTVDLALYCIKGDPYLSPLPAYLLGLVLSIVSMLLAHAWSQFKIKLKRKKGYEKKG